MHFALVSVRHQSVIKTGQVTLDFKQIPDTGILLNVYAISSQLKKTSIVHKTLLKSHNLDKE